MGWGNWSYSKRVGTITMALRLAVGVFVFYEIFSLSVFANGIFPEAFFTRFLEGLFAKSSYGILHPLSVFWLSWVECLFYWYLAGAIIGGIIGRNKFKPIE